jgi:hypothetical protein
LGSFMCGKVLPLWLGTASFIQVLLMAKSPTGCDKGRRQQLTRDHAIESPFKIAKIDKKWVP